MRATALINGNNHDELTELLEIERELTLRET